MSEPLRLIIVAENASMRMGGESARPLQYFRYLLNRGVDVRLVTHDRNRYELSRLIPEMIDRVHFTPDRPIHKWLSRLNALLPERVGLTTTGALGHLVTQADQRRLIRRLVLEHGVQVVHEPVPISPKQPSLMHDLGAPVVIGPLNGDINYPPAFRSRENRFAGAAIGLARAVSPLVNRLLPGKPRAATLIVSNERTRKALPRGCRGRVVQLVANAVDLSLWSPAPPREQDPSRPVVFVFTGRLVRFKCVDLLIEAFARVADDPRARLEIVGDGPERPALEEQCRGLGLSDAVHFTGWMSHAQATERMRQADVFVFPSLQDPGGAVVMEAMCLGLPVITSEWGGCADYADRESGILVPPDSRESFVGGLADAMRLLAGSPDLRGRMGEAARRRAVSEFDWNSRVDRLLEIYEETLERVGSAPEASSAAARS